MRVRTLRAAITLVALGASSAPALAQGAPEKTKVEEQVLLNGEPGMQYVISPKGAHAAAVVLRGSRLVVVNDGVEGPKFDEILAEGSRGQKVLFSLDGEHSLYVGRVGNEYVVMHDGKEVARGVPWSAAGSGNPTVTNLDFTPGGRHAYYISFTSDDSRQHYRLVIDGKPGPESNEPIQPLFSADGERHTYLLGTNPLRGERSQTLIVDGKPAGYLAGSMQFTGDGKHLFTQRGVPGANAMDELLDGQPFMRAGGIELHTAPVGPGVLGSVLVVPPSGPRSHFLTIGNRKVPGSECAGNAGIDRFYFSDDAKHFAVRCQATPNSFWVMIDGKKGREYQSVNSSVLFTADGRGVYTATMNGKVFVVVGEEESNAWQMTRSYEVVPPGGEVAPAVISGNHIAYIASRTQQFTNAEVVLDGKSYPSPNASYLKFSPDGSRLAWLSGAGALPSELAVDGVTQKGPPFLQETLQNLPDVPRFVFSPDAKHLAYATFPEGTHDRAIALDGRLVPSERVKTSNVALTFTPDSRHLLWTGVLGGEPRQLVFVDGEPVLEADRFKGSQQPSEAEWSMGADGVLTMVASDGGKVKRYRITPGSGRSIESMGGKGKRSGGDAAVAPSSPPRDARHQAAPAPAAQAPASAASQPPTPAASQPPTRAVSNAPNAASSSTAGDAPIDSWSRIRPGQTPRDEVERVIGAAQGTQQAFDGQFSVWRSALDTRELWLRFTDGGVVREMIVVPARALTDKDLADVLGPAKGKVAAASDGSYEVAYPVEMAVVDFTRSGTATRLVVGPDAIHRAESAALKAKAAEGIRSLFGKKKP